MIIGSGLVARAFAPYFTASPAQCVYAAGVSNSTCTDPREFDRERVRLENAITAQLSADLFIYFGTCSANRPPSQYSAYVRHKVGMERIVSAHPRHLILRLPQTAGRTANPHTLLNYFFDRISRSERFQVWKGARRNVIDIEDAARIGATLAIEDGVRGECIDIANARDIAVPELVDILARAVGKNAICDYVERDDADSIDVKRMQSAAARSGVSFGTRYLESVIEKYYGNLAAGRAVG